VAARPADEPVPCCTCPMSELTDLNGARTAVLSQQRRKHIPLALASRADRSTGDPQTNWLHMRTRQRRELVGAQQPRGSARSTIKCIHQ
jgi:hypothetical protein